MTGQLNLSAEVPKAQQFTAQDVPLDLALTVNDTTKTATLRVLWKDLNPSANTFTIASCTTINGQKKITTTGTFKDKVRVGDAITGTGIGGSAVVEAYVNDQEIRASVVSSASGTVTLTFAPAGPYDATLLALGIEVATRKDKETGEPYLDLTVNVLNYNGDLPDANNDGDDGATLAQGSTVRTLTFPKNLATFRRKARLADPT
jgi:hypothetical protein